jgi:transcriptional regulator with XRE-family HTH domain
MGAGQLIQEARLRAGLTQAALGELSGRERSHIARWERGDVEPSFSTLQEILRACGYELSTKLETYAPVDEETRRRLAAAAPSERLQMMFARKADALRYGNGH